jgi:uncharacterized iron-regulated membrane protein
VVAGLVILMMSVTGVMLTYERQILAWAGSWPGHRTVGQPRNACRERAHRVVAAAGARVRSSVGHNFDPSAHAGFDARAITGASNLGFLFLLLSGNYLWLPPVYNRVAFRTRFLFNAKARDGKARDFNWHHVFGIWSVLPLVVIVASATIFHYGWANAIVYRSFGEEPPVPGGAPMRETAVPDAAAETGEGLSLDEMTKRAALQVPDWRTLTLTVPEATATVARFNLDRGTGGQPQLRHEVILDVRTGEVISNNHFPGSSSQRARALLRFLHTGEALGIAGQTIAGLVSLFSAIMVWTGLALAWRRLIRPPLTRARLQAATSE